ncbi:uncharacterized protein METZ01_LOCUS481764, partial [marine metagenome]
VINLGVLLLAQPLELFEGITAAQYAKVIDSNVFAFHNLYRFSEGRLP